MEISLRLIKVGVTKKMRRGTADCFASFVIAIPTRVSCNFAVIKKLSGVLTLLSNENFTVRPLPTIVFSRGAAKDLNNHIKRLARMRR